MLKRLVIVLLLLAAACGTPDEAPEDEGSGGEQKLTIYSGREKELVGEIIEKFEAQTDIEVAVKYAGTSELATTIIEEGDRSPADVFFAQDAGALGAVAKAGLFAKLPKATLDKVPAHFRSRTSEWVGTSGRVRVAVYNTEEVSEDDLPDSVLGLTDAKWKDRIGWAPTNGSFQAFVTALRKTQSDEVAQKWLEDMKANGAKDYTENSAIVRAVAAGEIDAGLVNHYYLLEMGAEDATIREKAANFFFPNHDVGSLVNAAGVGVLKSADNPEAAQRFVDYLLSRPGTEYFGEEVIEYPLVKGIKEPEGLRPLAELIPPDVDLADLDDLEGTLELMRKADVL